MAFAPPHRTHHESALAAELVAEDVSSGLEAISPAKLVEILEEYLSAHPSAALLEEGRILFDMRLARYSVTESHGRCLLQLWSDERNLIRTVLEIHAQAVRDDAPYGRTEAPGPRTRPE